jgi:hypothetical protein
MKRKTLTRAMQRLLAAHAAREESETAAHSAAADCQVGTEDEAVKSASLAWQAQQRFCAADAAWKSLSKAQREYAADAVEKALRIGKLACRIGGCYSGRTTHEVAWGDTP